MAVSVHPPRAGVLAKQWRRSTWWPRFTVRQTAREIVRQLLHSEVYDGSIEPVMRRAVVPGWPQFYQGQRLRGCWFSGSFAMFALFAFAAIGTDEGAIWLGLAVAAHLSSALDVLLPATRGADRRWLQIASGLATIGAVTYLPLGVLAHFFFSPRQIMNHLATFDVGDGILVSSAVYHLRTPRPGDMVVYDIPPLDVSTTNGAHMQFVIRGQRIDRIIAGPGQKVRIENGILLVDGVASVNLPLNAGNIPNAFSTVVPPDEYLIFPSTVMMRGMNLSGAQWHYLSRVSTNRIFGLVYARYWPWSRFELL